MNTTSFRTNLLALRGYRLAVKPSGKVGVVEQTVTLTLKHFITFACIANFVRKSGLQSPVVANPTMYLLMGQRYFPDYSAYTRAWMYQELYSYLNTGELIQKLTLDEAMWFALLVNEARKDSSNN